MEARFGELIRLSRVALRCDPWVRDAGMTGYCRELKGEVDEALRAIQADDMDNLMEELGDIFLDLSRLCVLAEERGHFGIDDVLAGIIEKVKRRQPFLLEERPVTMDKALQYWNKAKKREKTARRGTDVSRT